MRKLVKLFRLPRRVYSKYRNIWVPSFAVGDVKELFQGLQRKDQDSEATSLVLSETC